MASDNETITTLLRELTSRLSPLTHTHTHLDTHTHTHIHTLRHTDTHTHTHTKDTHTIGQAHIKTYRLLDYITGRFNNNFPFFCPL